MDATMEVEGQEPTQFWKLKDQLHLEGVSQHPKANEDINLKSLWDALEFESFIANPIKVIDDLYASRAQISPMPVVEWEKKVLSTLNYKFREFRCKSDQKTVIPSINEVDVTEVKNGQLVTFRCMVQDMIGPEISVSQANITDRLSGETRLHSTLLRDPAEVEEADANPRNLVEKEIIIGVSPPGENPWVSCQSPLKSAENEAIGGKRGKFDDGTESEPSNPRIGFPDFKQVVPTLFPNQMNGSKPIACVLKLHKNDEMPKQNEVIEVCGVIYFFDGEVAKTDAFEECVHPDVLKLPVIHVCSYVKLAYGCPRLPIFDGKLKPSFDLTTLNIPECVNALRDVISLSLGGDRYAAVYVMMGLVSRVLTRDTTAHGNGPIGKLVVNLCALSENSDIPELLQNVIQSLMPRILSLNLTVENLNSWTLTPKKNMETNQLEPGLLQLCDGTVVIIDETNLDEGKLDQVGARNVEVLRELLLDQEVKYNYTYQFPTLPTDCPVISVSQSPSILPADIVISTKPEALSPSEKRARIRSLLEEKGSMLQDYLSFVRGLSLGSDPLLTDDSLMEDLEAFFKARNEPNAFKAKMTALDFSAFLTCCRLWCLLNGNVSITREGFSFMKELEQIKDSRS